MNFTRMHVFTHVRESMRGQSGMPGNEYADGMIEMDGDVGKLLKALDDAGIANDTIVIFTTDNGPNQFSWPDAATDNQGHAFDGEQNYRLHVPAHAPVKQYWSAVAYDRATHALIRETQRSSRSSQSSGLQANADGSVDVYLGPTVPAGKEANWIPTKAGGKFEVLFRLYGPEKPLFDKTWKLPDIEKVK